MQKWECLFLQNLNAYGPDLRMTGRETRLYYGQLEKTYSQDERAFYAFCNQLGGDGWELVGIDSEGAILTTAFRRPVQE